MGARIVARGAIANILKEHGLEPAPERLGGMLNYYYRQAA